MPDPDAYDSPPMPPRPARATALRTSLIGGGLATLLLASWLALHIAALFVLPIGWQALLIVPVLTWLNVGLFIVAHDAMHGTLTPVSAQLNHWLGRIAAACYANFSFSALLAQHRRHHDTPGSTDDPDFHKPSNTNGPIRFWPWYLAFMHRYFGKREWLLMTLRVGIYWLLGASLPNILVYFALPAWLSSAQLFYFGTYRPHRHETGAFADIHNARSSGYPLWLSLLTCFHFGYHHEHHLSPGTPWWRLPQLYKNLRG